MVADNILEEEVPRSKAEEDTREGGEGGILEEEEHKHQVVVPADNILEEDLEHTHTVEHNLGGRR